MIHPEKATSSCFLLGTIDFWDLIKKTEGV